MDHERPIERLLRRYAKKRRGDAGVPLELHPATRRLLQGEVARQFRKTGADKTSSSGWFAALRRRWIYATAAASVVVVAALWLYSNNSLPPIRFELAKQEVARAQAPVREQPSGFAKDADRLAPASPAPAVESGGLGEPVNAPALATLEKQKSADESKAAPPTTAVAVASERSDALADRAAATVATTSGRAPETDELEESSANARRLAAAPAAPAITPAPASQPTAPAVARTRQATTESLARFGIRRDAGMGSTTPAMLPPAGAVAAFESRASAPIARGGVEREKLPVLSQAFANRAPGPKSGKTIQAGPASPVLLNFEIEQAGNQLRVIDADGSTYLGEIAAAPSAMLEDGKKGAEALKGDGKLSLSLPQQNSVANNFYRVAGTNRTLNQPIVFTWMFLTPTNALAQSQTQAVDGLLKNQAANSTRQIPALFNNLGISGRAQINATREIEINAVPVNP